MQRKILVFVAIIVVVVIGWELWVHNAPKGGLGSDEVVDVSSKEGGSNTDMDGKPLGTVGPTPSRSDAPGTINGEPVPGAATNQPPAAVKATTVAQPVATPASLPTTDTVAPNPPNGLAFGGTGKFQWYRQGDLTWRVNTESGASCIAFATMDEWRKPIVYSHGCGNA